MTLQMPMWVIYQSPSDFPGLFVARLWENMPPNQYATASYLTALTLRALRRRLPPELHWLPRDPLDDENIVETWL